MMKENWHKGFTMMMAGFMVLGVMGTSFAATPDQSREIAREAAYSQPYQTQQPQQQANDKNKSVQQKENAKAVEKNEE